jgi:hypothetical protein
MEKLRFGVWIFPLLLAVLLLMTSPVEAVMQLIPPIQEIRVQRGYTGTFTITIKNVGDEDVPSTFTVHNMDITPEGAPYIADSIGGYERGFGDWVTLDTPEAIIKATESIILTGSVTVPKDAEGGYYALVKGTFVGTTIPIDGERAPMAEGSGIQLASQAVVAVLLTVPSSRNKPVIVPDTLFVYPSGEKAMEVDFGGSASEGWKVVLPVRNEGNVHTRISGQVSFWSESGTRIESAPFRVGRGYVLPDKLRNISAVGENDLADGYYMIRLSLQTEERATWTNSLPFAVYNGEVHPGAISDELAELIRASSPGFTLREHFVQKQITPGGSTYMAVQMISTVGDTLVLYPRKLEWSLNPMGQPVLSKIRSNQPRTCSEWIEFTDEKFVLPPGRRGTCKLKVTTPNDIGGEYYTAIAFDPEGSRKDLPAEFMASRTQLIALRTPQDLDYQVKVGKINVKVESSEEMTLYRFQFSIRNEGNIHCFASGNMSLEKEIAPETYRPVGTVKNFGDRQMYILPGGERHFEVDIPDLESGTYRVILAANYKEETQPVVRYQKFTF